MRDLATYDYAIVRVVPQVEREEFLNVGAILFCRTLRFLEARIEVDHQRLIALTPGVDVDDVMRHLAVIPLICVGGDSAGTIGRFDQAGRFHWLVAPRSGIIQMSAVHSGLCTDPAWALDHVMNRMVRVSEAARTPD